MRILAIGAHPDDLEFGCGGTLLKYAVRGHKIFILVMTSGQKGGDEKKRKGEQEAAANILKPVKVFWGGYRDTELKPYLTQMIHDIEKIIKEVKPELIFVHYQNDTHQDHRALSQATVSATRYIRNVLFYEGPTTQSFDPTVFVDIDESIEGKMALLLAHESQVMKTNIKGLSITDIALSNAVFRGIQGRVKHAEAFVPLRLFINMTGKKQ